MNTTTYDGLGFGPILLQGGVSETETPWGSATSFEKLSELHREIALAISRSAFPVTGKVLRFLRQTLDQTQLQLGEALGYRDGQMVAQWERGTREIPSATAKEIRLMVRGRLDPQASISLVLEEVGRPASQLEFVFQNGSWNTVTIPSGGWSHLSNIATTASVKATIPSNRMDYNGSSQPLAA